MHHKQQLEQYWLEQSSIPGMLFNTFTNTVTIHYAPCFISHLACALQSSQGVVFAAFELKVDNLMSLRVNYTDTLPLLQKVANNLTVNETTPAVVSAVMFR